MTGTLDRHVEQSQTPILDEENRFKLALFCVNIARGSTVSLDTSQLIQVTWDESVRICQAADRAGIDAVIPLARWRNAATLKPEFDRVFDSFTWAAGIAAVTERIQVFATFHVPLYPPVMAAKMVATVDHISRGRFGLNVVAGFSAADFAMFGIELDPAADRYARTAEWLGLMKRAWTEHEPFDHHGDSYSGQAIVSEPKPLQRPWPVIMCAGNSPAGKEFSARHAEVSFGVFPSFESIPEVVEHNRQAAREAGRPVKVFGHGYVVCADTEAEARRRLDHWVRDNVDEATAGAFVAATLKNSNSTKVFEDRFAHRELLAKAAAGALALPLVGTPEQVAGGIQRMADGGMDGHGPLLPRLRRGHPDVRGADPSAADRTRPAPPVRSSTS
ncbi:LLM class flavin-dependent oxidoreductase [Streptomyces graminofaciens]|uniref:LLM class flavin-dependent oxidoreductase n=1 Tax=Streptomyces graminofaciens TaxID=68212 RepID=UPI0025739739|nr:LLM class flavin-dependent oxidoreductase [Streptomyces graminofaciens]